MFVVCMFLQDGIRLLKLTVQFPATDISNENIADLKALNLTVWVFIPKK